jgi:hypothetical protein
MSLTDHWMTHVCWLAWSLGALLRTVPLGTSNHRRFFWPTVTLLQLPRGRAPLEPPHELASLDDYRARHKLFHTDAALVEMVRRAPMIAIW